MSPLARIVALPVHAYRTIFSPWVGFNCRYQPSCSTYALEALEMHGTRRGMWLAAHRIARCHPFGGSGVDNVPPPADSLYSGSAASTEERAACRRRDP